jgi:hypothetical protein
MPPYSEGTRLPGEAASKLGHLTVVQSPWVKSLIDEFESHAIPDSDPSKTIWETFVPSDVAPLQSVWAADGSYVAVTSERKPAKEVAFVKTALLLLDRVKLDAIDRQLPHPLLLRDAIKDTAVHHATVLPLKNVRTSLGTNYDAVRHIIRDSMKVDQGGEFFETLKWLAYSKWNTQGSRPSSPNFQCPHCGEELTSGLPYDTDAGPCDSCGEEVFLSDLWGFHLEMDDDSAPDSVASAYMMVMEHLMLFTAIRLMWHHTDRSLVANTLFIKDGPLTLRGQYSKMVPSIRSFLQHAKNEGRPVHVIGQEKSGAFFDHLSAIVRYAPPFERGQLPSFAALSHAFVRREVNRSPNMKYPYGFRTNWGEKVFFKVDPGSFMVLNVPTGDYLNFEDRPVASDLIGLSRILATLPILVSHKFEGALYPVELANGIASMSSYPSATILKRFLDAQEK